MKKTGDITNPAEGSINVTGKVTGDINQGLDEKKTAELVGQQLDHKFEKLIQKLFEYFSSLLDKIQCSFSDSTMRNIFQIVKNAAYCEILPSCEKKDASDSIKKKMKSQLEKLQSEQEKFAKDLLQKLSILPNSTINETKILEVGKEYSERANIEEAKINLLLNIEKLFPKKKEIIFWADRLRNFKADDFLANFCYNFCNENIEALNECIYYNCERYKYRMETIIQFAIEKMNFNTTVAIGGLIQWIKDENIIDSNLYARLNKLYTKRNKKIIRGVYDPTKKRDCFIAFKSEEQQYAGELVNYLQEERIKCYYSIKNLQHGYDDDYRSTLRTAISNCSVFILVSSKASRSSDDVVDIEIERVKEIEREKYPEIFSGHMNYKLIDRKYKLPRIEYVIENYSSPLTQSELKVREFFDGYERVFADNKDKKDAMKVVKGRIESFKECSQKNKNNTIKNVFIGILLMVISIVAIVTLTLIAGLAGVGGSGAVFAGFYVILCVLSVVGVFLLFNYIRRQ